MLKITIELYPEGDQNRAKVLGVMQIAQVKFGKYSDYKIVADENPNPITKALFNTGVFSVQNHDRNQSVYGLVAKAARKAADHFNRKIKRKQYVKTSGKDPQTATAVKEK